MKILTGHKQNRGSPHLEIHPVSNSNKETGEMKGLKLQLYCWDNYCHLQAKSGHGIVQTIQRPVPLH
jgi:hypothetical protein